MLQNSFNPSAIRLLRPCYRTVNEQTRHFPKRTSVCFLPGQCCEVPMWSAKRSAPADADMHASWHSKLSGNAPLTHKKPAQRYELAGDKATQVVHGWLKHARRLDDNKVVLYVWPEISHMRMTVGMSNRSNAAASTERFRQKKAVRVLDSHRFLIQGKK